MALSKQRLKYSFAHAFRGVKDAYQTQQNFRIHLYTALLTIIFSILFRINHYEWMIIVASIVLVIVMELTNTAIEYFADLIKQEYDLKIKIVKDISAAAVLISVLLAVFVGCIVFIPKIWSLFL